MIKKKKTRAGLAGIAIIATLALAGCAETYTFEVDPQGGSGDNWSGDPATIQCFTIEADSSVGDDNDRNLGVFCKKEG